MSIRTQGLVFPLELTSGAYTIAQEDDLIKSSIAIILSWPIFSREYLDDFGSRIHEALEQPNDNILITLLQNFVVDALSKNESRIKIRSMKFTRHSYDKLSVDLTYIIKDINLESSTSQTIYLT